MRDYWLYYELTERTLKLLSNVLGNIPKFILYEDKEDIGGQLILKDRALELFNINEEIILINLKLGANDDFFIGTIAHEYRHFYQFQNKEKSEIWNKEFLIDAHSMRHQIKTLKNGIKKLEIELDAYTFEECFVNFFFGRKDFKIKFLEYFNQEKVNFLRKEFDYLFKTKLKKFIKQ